MKRCAGTEEKLSCALWAAPCTLLAGTYCPKLVVINVESSRIERLFHRDYRGEIDGLLQDLRSLARCMFRAAKSCSLPCARMAVKNGAKRCAWKKDASLNAELVPHVEKSSSKRRLWIAGGAAALETATHFILSPKESGGNNSEGLPPFAWPPKM